MTAHGVSRGQCLASRSVLITSVLPPTPVNASTSDDNRCSAMRNTTVCVDTYGGGSGAAPFRPVPVQMRTWSATLRCVAGIAAKRGAERELVMPGSTIGVYPFSRKKAYSSAPRP